MKLVQKILLYFSNLLRVQSGGSLAFASYWVLWIAVLGQAGGLFDKLYMEM